MLNEYGHLIVNDRACCQLNLLASASTEYNVGTAWLGRLEGTPRLVAKAPTAGIQHSRGGICSSTYPFATPPFAKADIEGLLLGGEHHLCMRVDKLGIEGSI